MALREKLLILSLQDGCSGYITNHNLFEVVLVVQLKPDIAFEI